MKNKFSTTSFLTDKITDLKIAVIGDMMLDCYYYGSVGRISPEAPVPVNRVMSESMNLGGAGNVAANLARLGSKVYMCSVCGKDENAGKLRKLLRQLKIDDTGILYSKEYQTTSKLRIIGSNQQMLRLDFEKNRMLDETEEKKLLKWFIDLLKEGLDGVVISDYGKGFLSYSFCQNIIKKANSAKIPILVDPKGYNWEKYENADYITPNIKELGEAVQVVPENKTVTLAEFAKGAINKYKVKSVLVTRSEKGMTFVSPQQVFTTPATAREVYDVSGAGDTVAAVFLAAVAGGLSAKEGAFLANEAAGIVVGRSGTYAIKQEELLNCLLEKEYDKNRKYRPLTWDEIESLANSWHKLGRKIVFTNGCFDILHTGHITYLEKAAEMGDHLIIGLNTDESVKMLKGQARPLVAQADRARLLAALGCVDSVVLFGDQTPSELIKRIRPDILVKGGDYCEEEVAGREYAKKVKIIDFEEGYSTTDIISRIAVLVKEGKL